MTARHHAMSRPSTLWDHRLLVVTGKGGVGKSVVTAALALAASQAGRRVCTAEIYGQNRIGALFGLKGRAYVPRPTRAGVHHMSLTPMECLDDFGRRKLKLNALVKVFFRNRVMSAFIDAVPGLHDLLQLGKIENLLNEPLASDPKFDLIILDAPSTGHGLTLLAAARSMRELARRGPFHDLAAIIERQLEDVSQSGLVITTLPEELPVQETLELLEGLGSDRKLLASVILNRVHPVRLPHRPPWPELRSSFASSSDPDVRELARLADEAYERQETERHAMGKLAAAFEHWDHQVDLLHLPEVVSPHLESAALDELGQILYREAGGDR